MQKKPTTSGHDNGLRLLVAMPALNEEATVGDVISRVPREIPGISRVEVLVVNDGSTDKTPQIAAEAGAHVINHSSSLGVGAAFQSALSFAIEQGMDLIATIDSDGQFNPADIPKLIEPIVNDEADFTTASRFKDKNLIPDMTGVKLWGNRMMSRLITRLTIRQTGQRFFDVSCGMRGYNRRAMLQLNLLGEFTYTQEVFLNLAFKRMRIVEVPIKVRGIREFGKSRVASNLFKYAFNTSRIIFRSYRDYHPLRFFGWAAASLAAPGFGLLIFLVTHYFMSGGFSPHKWAGFTGGGLLALSLMVLHMGIIGDMMNRHRIYLEELLFHVRQNTLPPLHHRDTGQSPDGDSDAR